MHFVTAGGNASHVGKFRRGNYIFLTWKGDHSPRHVHVYRNRKLVLKWNLDDRVPMKGEPKEKILALIAELEEAGEL